MPRRIVRTAEFERAYLKLSEAHQHLIDKALTQFYSYLDTGKAPWGLGIKHLGKRTYELRVGLALRIVYVVEGETVVFALLGTHDEVRRFLKRWQ